VTNEAVRSPRDRLHHAIRNRFATSLREYYEQHPEQLDDPNSERGVKALLKLLENVLTCIDQYDIHDPA
jgi:hypothetical protein